jgi:hypothetical protein
VTTLPTQSYKDDFDPISNVSKSHYTSVQQPASESHKSGNKFRRETSKNESEAGDYSRDGFEDFRNDEDNTLEASSLSQSADERYIFKNYILLNNSNTKYTKLINFINLYIYFFSNNLINS